MRGEGAARLAVAIEQDLLEADEAVDDAATAPPLGQVRDREEVVLLEALGAAEAEEAVCSWGGREREGESGRERARAGERVREGGRQDGDHGESEC